MRDAWMFVMFFASFGSSHATLSYSNVAISNSGYTGLVIAIHPDVAEDQKLIQAIKVSYAVDTWHITRKRARHSGQVMLILFVSDAFQLGLGQLTHRSNRDL